MRNSNGLMALFAIFCMFISFSESLCSDVDIKITEPSNEKFEVRQIYNIRGSAFIPTGSHLWVLARRTDFEGVWWPQAEAKINPVSKEFSVAVTFGVSDDIGWEFDVAVIVVDESQNARLKNYCSAAMQIGSWRPIEMPMVLTHPVLLKARKIGH